MRHTTHIETWPLKVPFVISRRTCEAADVLTVTLERNGHIGRSEAAGINYKGETPQSMAHEINAFMASAHRPVTRQMMLNTMPAGGARNALDCALWDLEAKETGSSVFELSGALSGAVQTAFTLSVGTPKAMAEAAASNSLPVLKLKLAGINAVECVAAVRNARPDASIIVDANEALSFEDLKVIAPQLADLRVSLIEQPLHRDSDEVLAGYTSPVPLCADESCMTATDLPRLKRLYKCINIKLDKTGGLTAAIKLADEAERMGINLMVGCMLGTSLAMAPAMIVAPRCQFVDLDGPLLLAKDRKAGLDVEHGTIRPPTAALWG